MVLSKKIKTLSAGFFKYPTDGRGHGLKCIESKNRQHFEIPTFWVLQLCASYPGWFMHFKPLKNAPYLWFGCFSSDVKCCTCLCLQCFPSELKRSKQRQGAFLWHLKCTNHPGNEAQSCSTQKVGFSKRSSFFDSMHFRSWPVPSSGFLKNSSRKVFTFLVIWYFLS